MAFAREIYLIDVKFEDQDCSKERPVLVLLINGSALTIAPITSEAPPSNPTKYYDKAKEELKKWRKYGLDKPSYVKCADIKTIDISALKGRPIGRVDVDEFDRITEKICWYM